MCGTSLYGGVFWLSQGTPFNDAYSIFESNTGAYGGVINCQNCTMDLYSTKFFWNQAWRGGVIELRDYAYMKTNRVTFDKN
jgi:predicted outer membrane repeat protein